MLDRPGITAEYLSNLDRAGLEALYARVKLAELRRAQERRAADPRRQALQRARGSFLGFCEHVLAKRGMRPALHHRLWIDELQGVADGETPRLMSFAPPGSAKSTYFSKLFPPYLLMRHRDAEVIGASHTATLALKFSYDVQAIINDNVDVLGYHLTVEDKKWWFTSGGGSYRAAGVGGSIPGTRASYIIIDDPIKNREAADSETERDNVWNWYNGDLEFRRKPNAPIILMHTRWHNDDLAGRLLDVEADLWRIVTLRAIAEEGGDPLGREPGEWLWADSEDYDYVGWLKEQRALTEGRGATREWASQFQQRPRPAEGILFKVDRIPVVEAAPAKGQRCRAWDLAATEETGSRDAAWTRGLLGVRSGRDYFVEDVVGVRGTPDDVLSLIKYTARRDRERYGPVTISLPQDPGQAGKMQAEFYVKELAGYTVKTSPESGDKVERAGPVASQCNISNVSIVRGPWNAAFLDELGAFPAGTYKDQVDALSRWFGEVGISPPTFQISDEMRRRARAGTLIPRVQSRAVRV